MELILHILMLFIVVNTILKLSFWKWWQAAVFGVSGALFITFSSQFAILQSKTQLADYLSNHNIMQDMAVFITIESMFCVIFCLVAFRSVHTEKRPPLWTIILHWYPGLLLFPVLFYLLTQTIYALPGCNFTTTAYIMATVVAISLPFLSRIVRYFCPETELRLEVHFLASLFVCVIGLITTVNGNVTYAAAEEPFDQRAALLSVSLFLVAFLTGILLNKRKWSISSKKQKSFK